MLTLVTLRRKHIRRPACRTIACHAANRMNREQFYARVSALDAEQLRKIL
jgi:hypothetical protein